MFNPTQAHEKEISKGQYKIRMGDRVPEGAVNLAYSYVTPLNPEENVQIADTSGFILENVSANKQVDYRAYPDEAYLLRNANGQSDIYSQTFLLTNVFAGGEGLYYVHRLKYKIIDTQGPRPNGEYRGRSISVQDKSGSALKSSEYISIRLVGAGEGLYYVDIFTNFKAAPGREYKVIYNGVDVNPEGKRTVFSALEERMIPKPAFEEKATIDEVTKPGLENERIYYKTQMTDFGYTQVYVSQRKENASSQMYAIRPLDNAQIQVLAPVAKNGFENWFLRVRNGRFYRGTLNSEKRPEGFGYFLPEYYKQPFDEEYGMPYRKVQSEKPEIIGERQIKLRYTPLHITMSKDTLEPNNIRVEVNKLPIQVRSWDSESGIIELDGTVKSSDNIRVDYLYMEISYEYRGYWDEENQKYWYLDLNPGKGHVSTQYDKDSDEIRDLASTNLVSKTIYLYLRPAGSMSNIVSVSGERINLESDNTYKVRNEALSVFTPKVYERFSGLEVLPAEQAKPGETAWEIVESGYLYQHIRILNPKVMNNDYYVIDYSYTNYKYRFVSGTFNEHTLFHTFEESEEPNAILLGKIQVRPNSSRESIKLVDTRTNGGGLLESIGEQIIKEIMPEGLSYWDIGYWDGVPYQENAVVVIRLPKYILKEAGGTMSKQEVETAVEKHIAYGSFYIVEYIEESVALLEVPQNLVVEIFDMPQTSNFKLRKPTFKLITEG